MRLTDYHAKYFAHELTERSPAGNMEDLAGVLVDSRIEALPHRVDAALFTFKDLLSMGALLADEVGLGKTIARKSYTNLNHWLVQYTLPRTKLKPT